MQRRGAVLGAENLAEVEVELVLAPRRPDVLRDAQEVPVVGVGIAAALGKMARELRPARQERASLRPCLLAAIAEIRTRAEERDHPSAAELVGYGEKMVVVCSLHPALPVRARGRRRLSPRTLASRA